MRKSRTTLLKLDAAEKLSRSLIDAIASVPQRVSYWTVFSTNANKG
jgi:hypothetical protein